jgi:hypothetical protein
MSSTAASTPGHALGIAKATDIFQNFPATFMGQTVDDTDVLSATRATATRTWTAS